MTPWGRNFLSLMVLTTENYWLIGGTHLRCCFAVGMDADVRFLTVAEKARHALNSPVALWLLHPFKESDRI